MPADFIHNFVAGKLTSTVLVLHGSGGDENDLLPIAKALAQGAAFLSPRGKSVESGAARFFTREADEAEVRARASELAGWIAAMAAQHGLDPSRIFAMGFSNGANIAAALMLLHPGVLAGALLLRPKPALELAELPDLKGAPVIVIAGSHDETMQAGESEKLARTLGRAGAAVEMAMLDAEHGLTPQDFSLARDWFAKVLM